jgi:hypothetical protein
MEHIPLFTPNLLILAGKKSAETGKPTNFSR